MTLIERLNAWPTTLRRALALGILVLIVTAVGLVTIYPLARAAQAHLAWRDDATHLLARQRALLRLRPVVSADVSRLRQHPLLTRLYTPPAGTPFSTQFEADIGALLQQAGVAIFQTRAERTTSVESLTRASVAIDLTGDVALLSRLLALIAQHERFVEVATLTIEVPPAPDDDSNVPFSMRLMLAGYSATPDTPSTDVAPNAVAAISSEPRP